MNPFIIRWQQAPLHYWQLMPHCIPDYVTTNLANRGYFSVLRLICRLIPSYLVPKQTRKALPQPSL